MNFNLMSNPYAGLLLTIGAFWIGQMLYDKTKWSFLQPILTASIIVITILSVFNLSYKEYYNQNAILNYMLPLTAVVLALPLYRNRNILKKYSVAIFAGIIAGTPTTLGAILVVGKLIGTDVTTLISMIPKSATNPIAFEVSKIIGGIPSVTVALVVIAGVIGGVVGPELLKLMGIKNEIAKGIAIGSISHAIGTARSFKEGELQGSMSSLAMALAGMLTAILAPLIVMLL